MLIKVDAEEYLERELKVIFSDLKDNEEKKTAIINLLLNILEYNKFGEEHNID